MAWEAESRENSVFAGKVNETMQMPEMRNFGINCRNGNHPVPGSAATWGKCPFFFRWCSIVSEKIIIVTNNQIKVIAHYHSIMYDQFSANWIFAREEKINIFIALLPFRRQECAVLHQEICSASIASIRSERQKGKRNLVKGISFRRWCSRASPAEVNESCLHKQQRGTWAVFVIVRFFPFSGMTECCYNFLARILRSHPISLFSFSLFLLLRASMAAIQSEKWKMGRKKKDGETETTFRSFNGRHN